MSKIFFLTYRNATDSPVRKSDFATLEEAQAAGAAAWAAGASRVWVWEPKTKDAKGKPGPIFRHMPTLPNGALGVIWARTASLHGIEKYWAAAQLKASEVAARKASFVARLKKIAEATKNG